jgi:hypothetical protein
MKWVKRGKALAEVSLAMPLAACIIMHACRGLQASLLSAPRRTRTRAGSGTAWLCKVSLTQHRRLWVMQRDYWNNQREMDSNGRPPPQWGVVSICAANVLCAS